MTMATTLATALSVGDKLSNHLMLGNKQIPLPVGVWVVAGLGTQPFTMPALLRYDPDRGAISHPW
jgi:hypothetical protein